MDVEREAPSELCYRIELTRDWLRDERLTFVDLLTDKSEAAMGIRAGLAFLRPADPEGAARFRPALRYLSKRGAAEAAPDVQSMPKLTDAIKENARKLDEFLADGGCG